MRKRQKSLGTREPWMKRCTIATTICSQFFGGGRGGGGRS